MNSLFSFILYFHQPYIQLLLLVTLASTIFFSLSFPHLHHYLFHHHLHHHSFHNPLAYQLLFCYPHFHHTFLHHSLFLSITPSSILLSSPSPFTSTTALWTFCRPRIYFPFPKCLFCPRLHPDRRPFYSKKNGIQLLPLLTSILSYWFLIASHLALSWCLHFFSVRLYPYNVSLR